jgi:hypothetical protein
LLPAEGSDRDVDASDGLTATAVGTPAATLPASGDTRANTNAGIGPALTRDVLVARSE